MLVINPLPQIVHGGKIINRHGTELHPLGFRWQDPLRGGGLVLGAVVVSGEVQAHVHLEKEGGREGGEG